MPDVTVIVPCFNEATTIGALLQALLDQTHPVKEMQILVVDGGSTDGTQAVVSAFAESHAEMNIELLQNPARMIPHALNIGIGSASGEVVIRLDAHSVPYPDYVQLCLETLEKTEAANVGGAWEIHPGTETWIARSIAAAASHPLGAGDARYRTAGQAGEVETVPFGAFRADWLRRVGPFNEALLTNEDYEYNARILKAGGKIWFDPGIRTIYFARSRYAGLARQYARYGYWKARMLLAHPGTLRWRQAAPPAFVAAMVVLGLGSVFWQAARWLLAVQLGGYAAVTILAGILEAFRRRDPAVSVGFAIALWVMHLSWGGAFLVGLFLRLPQATHEYDRA